jgi:hypothetical protein
MFQKCKLDHEAIIGRHRPKKSRIAFVQSALWIQSYWSLIESWARKDNDVLDGLEECDILTCCVSDVHYGLDGWGCALFVIPLI